MLWGQGRVGGCAGLVFIHRGADDGIEPAAVFLYVGHALGHDEEGGAGADVVGDGEYP